MRRRQRIGLAAAARAGAARLPPLVPAAQPRCWVLSCDYQGMQQQQQQQQQQQHGKHDTDTGSAGSKAGGMDSRGWREYERRVIK